MKKALKISTYCLLVSGVVALGLCYIIIPDRTKSAIDIVIEYLNKPLGVAFGTTITLGLVVGVIVKLLWNAHRDNIKQDISDYKTFIANEKEKLSQQQHEISVKESEIKAYLGAYTTTIDKLTDLVLKGFETIPNAKVRAIAEEIKNTKLELTQELENKKEIVSKYSDDEIKTLLDKVNEIEKVVKTYETREETTND